MIERLSALMAQRQERRVAVAAVAAYWLLYLLAMQDLSLHTQFQAFSVIAADQPWQLMWKVRAPFQFEPVVLLRAPFLSWTLSPVNAAIGLILAVLVGINLALAWTALRRPQQCSARPATGLVAALPGLLAGSACCGPALFLALGVPVTATVLGLFGVLVPASAVLLVVALAVNLRKFQPDEQVPVQFGQEHIGEQR